jgi:hypothetical protein
MDSVHTIAFQGEQRGVQNQHIHFERYSFWSDALESTSAAHLYGIFQRALEIYISTLNFTTPLKSAHA